ncbi:fimbrial protein [Escherichia coli]|uniref:fimbrial protein n=1 Tax=Escherichia coli TaxID=562 RepID=UPI000BE4FCC9|nr:fimbrial protein [Escherichia coli]
MAAANPVGTHNTTVSGSFVSPTCMVTEWPQDISFDPISVADWGNYNIQDTIQVKSQGQFVLTGCPANTAMKYSVTAETLAQGNPYQALAKDADDGQTLNGLGISFSASENGATAWKLDGTEANLGRTDDQGGLSVPAFASLKKRGTNITKNNQVWDGGNFNQVNTYTISYD